LCNGALNLTPFNDRSVFSHLGDGEKGEDSERDEGVQSPRPEGVQTVRQGPSGAQIWTSAHPRPGLDVRGCLATEPNVRHFRQGEQPQGPRLHVRYGRSVEGPHQEAEEGPQGDLQERLRLQNQPLQVQELPQDSRCVPLDQRLSRQRGDLPAAEQQQVQVDEKPSAGQLPETVTTHHFAMVRVESLLDEGEAVLAEPPLELDQVAKNPRLVLEPLLSVVFLLFIFKYF
jgi:hypothetical protein